MSWLLAGELPRWALALRRSSMVEQRTVNPLVVGSSPTAGAVKLHQILKDSPRKGRCCLPCIELVLILGLITWLQVRVLPPEPNRMIRVLRLGASPLGGQTRLPARQVAENFPRLFGFKANRLRAQNVVRANSFEKIPTLFGIFL